MSLWLLYLMTRTETFAATFGLLTFAGTLALVMFAIFLPLILNDELLGPAEEARPTAFLWLRRGLIAVLCCALLASCMPSKKDWYLIVGGYYVTNIDGIDKLPPNVVAAANAFLQEYAKEKP